MSPPQTAPSAKPPPTGLGVVTGTSLIVANIIGLGVFTTTGYMVAAIPSPAAVLLAWLMGGIAALCGALTYAELGSALPRNGGEYLLLSRIFHPAIGFVAGVISLVVGFSAPLALFAKYFGRYLHQLVPRIPDDCAGLCLIAFFAVLHSVHVAGGRRSHNAFTIGKASLILLFIVGGALRGSPELLTAAQQELGESVFSSAFAVQLVYVSFAYGGWNTAAYFAGEFEQPQRDVPRAVVAGVGIVTALYLGLNAVFLMSAPLTSLAGKEEVAHVAAVRLFGDEGGRIVSLMIVIGLVSTVSANLMSGPRVYEVMGVDYPRLSFLATRRAGGGPVVAIALQALLAAAMLMTSSFEGLLKYIGVTLSACAAATVLGAIVLRIREPNLPRPYRIPGYPLTPIVFLAVEVWMIVFTVRTNPMTAAWGAATIAVGLALYAVVRTGPTSRHSNARQS